MDTFTFFIPSIISNYMYDKMNEGQLDTYNKGWYTYFGAERGGNFNFTISENKITAISVNDSPLMYKTSSLNTGDYPFTFHTHPILSRCKLTASGGTRRRKRKGGGGPTTRSGSSTNIRPIRSTRTIKSKPTTTYVCRDYEIDNYPNLISDADLIGCVEDNIVPNKISRRKICGSATSTRSGGISIFDIVAVPYGLFVYRPSPDFLSKHENSIKKAETFIKHEFNEYKDEILPNYDYTNRNDYNNAVNDQLFIEAYMTKLRDNGFIINFFRWEDAMANEISFTLDNITEDMITRITGCIDSSV